MRGDRRRGHRERWLAHAFVLLLLSDLLLPIAALLATTSPASAALVTTTEDGRSQFLAPVTGVPYGFNISFLLPKGAQIDSLDFTIVPYVNMTLWNSSEFVTVLQGSVAVPLNVSANAAPEIGDLDGDGVPDLLVSGMDGSLHAYARIGS